MADSNKWQPPERLSNSIQDVSTHQVSLQDGIYAMPQTAASRALALTYYVCSDGSAVLVQQPKAPMLLLLIFRMNRLPVKR